MDQSAVDWLIAQLETNGIPIKDEGLTIQIKIPTLMSRIAKEREIKQSQQYVEFCFLCERDGLPLLDFESFMKH